MRTSSFLVLVVLFILGTLAVEAAVKGVSAKGQGTGKGRVPLKGQDPLKGQVSGKDVEPVKGKGPVRGPGSTKSGSCPNILIRCAMLNPPNHCLSDTQCPGTKKCCEGSCGKRCMDPQ
ncbi:elafin [Otolemur garnettii]|uniref:Elafin preproprotein n=1 Tax=Otolemur garnettii TaxID=30611 RepID=A4K2Q8_OTOGA|nr:elafin [Otolemur garnettii]ABO52943.1 elafin preproprotein [Otolemur garnettii]FAA00663.1 TPA: trappin-2 [Otolemur garnettii]